jgi:hypothetical protein
MSDFNLLSGTETRSDGTTTTYGANWEISGESVALTSLTALTANDFNAEVIKFDANATDVASGLVKLSDVYDFSDTGSSTLRATTKKKSLTGVMDTKSHILTALGKLWVVRWWTSLLTKGLYLPLKF